MARKPHASPERDGTRFPIARCAAAGRWAATAAAWALLGLAVTFALFVTAPRLLGYETLTVLSGSMEPTLPVGSVVLDERISPLDARIGEVVTFRSPQNRARLITHRLRSIRARGGNAYAVTKGDANKTVEHWSVPVSGRIGRVAYRVPSIGYAREWISGSSPRQAILIAVLCLAVWMLVDIWRPRRNGMPGEPSAATGPTEAPRPPSA